MLNDQLSRIILFLTVCNRIEVVRNRRSAIKRIPVRIVLEKIIFLVLCLNHVFKRRTQSISKLL